MIAVDYGCGNQCDGFISLQLPIKAASIIGDYHGFLPMYILLQPHCRILFLSLHFTGHETHDVQVDKEKVEGPVAAESQGNF